MQNRKSNIPAILIKGGKSRYVSEKGFQATKDVLPDLRLLTIDEAGHLPHVETPEVFYELLEKFLLV